MSNKLGGKQGTAYLGTNANQPPNWVFADRDPTNFDINYSLGDIWLNTSTQGKFILSSLDGTATSKGALANWDTWGSTGTGIVSITGTDLVAVPGDVSNRVYFTTTIPGLTMTSGAPANPNTLIFGASGGGNLLTKLIDSFGNIVNADVNHAITTTTDFAALKFDGTIAANTMTLTFTGGGPGTIVQTLSGDTATAVQPDVNGNIGVVSNIPNVDVTENVVANQLELDSSTGGSLLETVTGNSGGAVSGDAVGNINIIGDGVTATVAGNPATNTLTITTTATGFTWVQVAVAAQTLAHTGGYIANFAGTLVFSLPVTAAIGDSYAVTGMNNDTGWLLSQNAGQTIYFGEDATTTGVTGYLASTKTRDTVYLVCTNTNTDFTVVASIGNITVV